MAPPPKPLKVIALISGGKDSIYSLLHVLSLGHRVLALGNLYPQAAAHVTSTPSSSTTSTTTSSSTAATGTAADDDAPDPDSHMYQTAGHALIPAIARALGLPLFRAPIVGRAVVGGSTYAPLPGGSGTGKEGGEGDETESLLPLLQAIKKVHPTADAVSAGAILSTYQRTRIESVAARMGLVPLAFLWQYPSIFKEDGEAGLLAHMEEVGMEARIVKVASGGLGEGELWVDVVSRPGRERVGRKVGRFGGVGGVIGEGGEYETVVVSGGKGWWSGKVGEGERRVVAGEGGTAWVEFEKGEVVVEEGEGGGEGGEVKVRKPKLLEKSFEETLKAVLAAMEPEAAAEDLGAGIDDTSAPFSASATWKTTAHPDSSTWTIVPSLSSTSTSPTASEAMASISTQLSALLTTHNLSIKDIVSTTLLLTSMSTFASTNTVYASLFSAPNPPSRACVSVGSLLPDYAPVVMHISLSSAPTRRALHVQSRSYWAPANIGPYSQAQCAPLLPGKGVEGVYIAGQIPLVPATMDVVAAEDHKLVKEKEGGGVGLQIVLALQHLWRVGLAMDVSFFASGTAVMARCGLEVARRRAMLAGVAWENRHRRVVEGEEDGKEEDVDLWELTNRRGEEMMGGEKQEKMLPEWENVEGEEGGLGVSPFWAAEVEELPRGVDVEWLAGAGVVGESVKVRSLVSGGGSGVHECVVGGKVVITTMFVGYEEARGKGLVRVLLGGVPGKEELGGAEMVYLDAGIEELWGEVGGNVVPCRSLWDKEGTRLGAVVVFKSEVL
ncbi:hypothetical protein VE02_01505 [Pseudogymnoascus sp. 03VT05]|nr:hypothetical protein VE02_01505 [Pseudogymnoascus sp. 03VT05]